jgi:putative hydrolase of the HAD superfamily
MPGATSLLQLLKRHGIKVAVVTNGRSDLQRSVMKALGFDVLADAVVVSEEVGIRKPHPRIFELTLEAVACEPREAVMIGDDPVADLEGAQSAGIFPIAFKCTYSGGGASVGNMESAGVEILCRLGRAA